MANVVVIGGGGREHAICHALKKSKKVNKIYAIPGNDGMVDVAECISCNVLDFDGILKILKSIDKVDLVVIGPDDPLVAGLQDFLSENGYRAFGPNKVAAQLEGSKIFSKRLLKKYNIPTAKFEEFTSIDLATKYVKENKVYPLVIKANGLALGKGVIIAQNEEEALQACHEMLIDKKFGESGAKILIEEFLVGKEVSILCFVDGDRFIPMVSSQDHKRAFDNDEGLNTGGMGTFTPSMCYTKGIQDFVEKNIIQKTLDALKKENIIYKGVLYVGLMLCEKEGPNVLEFNARFGDPETQVILPRLESDIYDIFNACIDGTLDKIDVKWSDKNAVCVILASGGYPLDYEKGKEITISDIEDGVTLFFAGVKKDGNKLITNGGRVLGVTALGNTMQEAREIAYRNVKKIHFDKMHYRTDIGIKF